MNNLMQSCAKNIEKDVSKSTTEKDFTAILNRVNNTFKKVIEWAEIENINYVKKEGFEIWIETHPILNKYKHLLK